MFKIKGHGIVWDIKAEKPLIRFENGEAETADAEVAERLKKLGFEVVDIPDVPEVPEVVEVPEVNQKSNRAKGK